MRVSPLGEARLFNLGNPGIFGNSSASSFLRVSTVAEGAKGNELFPHVGRKSTTEARGHGDTEKNRVISSWLIAVSEATGATVLRFLLSSVCQGS